MSGPASKKLQNVFYQVAIQSLSSITEGEDFNLTLSDRVIVFSPSNVMQDFSFLVFQDGRFESPDILFLRLLAAAGETAVDVAGVETSVNILDSDGMWLVVSGLAVGWGMEYERCILCDRQGDISVQCEMCVWCGCEQRRLNVRHKSCDQTAFYLAVTSSI